MAVRRKPRGRHHHGDLRNALLQETLRIVQAQGVEAVSLRAVAKRLGVSAAAPYHHFTDKLALLAPLVGEGYARLRARMEADIAAAGGDPVLRLAAAVRSYVAHARAHPGLFRAQFGGHLKDMERFEHGREDAKGTYQLLVDIARICADGDLTNGRRIERAAWSAAHGVAWLLLEREIEPAPDDVGPDGVVEDAIAVLVAGVRAMRRE